MRRDQGGRERAGRVHGRRAGQERGLARGRTDLAQLRGLPVGFRGGREDGRRPGDPGLAAHPAVPVALVAAGGALSGQREVSPQVGAPFPRVRGHLRPRQSGHRLGHRRGVLQAARGCPGCSALDEHRPPVRLLQVAPRLDQPAGPAAPGGVGGWAASKPLVTKVGVVLAAGARQLQLVAACRRVDRRRRVVEGDEPSGVVWRRLRPPIASRPPTSGSIPIKVAEPGGGLVESRSARCGCGQQGRRSPSLAENSLPPRRCSRPSGPASGPRRGRPGCRAPAPRRSPAQASGLGLPEKMKLPVEVGLGRRHQRLAVGLGGPDLGGGLGAVERPRNLITSSPDSRTRWWGASPSRVLSGPRTR